MLLCLRVTPFAKWALSGPNMSTTQPLALVFSSSCSSGYCLLAGCLLRARLRTGLF